MSTDAVKIWEIASASTLLAAAASLAVWLWLRKRPTPEEIELARRAFLTHSGRLVDGTLLDVYELPSASGQTLTMLLYDYRIGGVDYQCSQDITHMRPIIDASTVRAGFPCSVRYQPGNPQNSIIVAEKWSGLRARLTTFPGRQYPEPIDSPSRRGKSQR